MRKTSIKKYFLFLLLILIIEIIPSPINAQTSIRFNHLTVKEGLSQSAVNCIFQDSKGFLWFGTQDGLNRYDGYNFKVFKNVSSDSTSLKENFILSIFEDDKGFIYCQTRNGIINKYDPLNENFSVITESDFDFSNFRTSAVLPSIVDTYGYHWVVSGGKGKGLLRFNPNTNDSIWFKNNSQDPGSISDDRVYSVYQDKNNTIWIGTFNGLDKYNRDSNSFTHYRHNGNNPNSISDNWVWPIFEDTEGTFWIGTVRGGLNKFNRKTGKFYNYKNEPTNPNSLNSNFILSIYEDKSGVVWIGTSDAGLNYFHPSSNYFEHYVNDPQNINSVSDNTILSILVDHKGITWIGTRNKGLNRFDHSTGKFTNYQNQPGNPNSIIANAIPLLYEDKSGIIWIGTFSNGLDYFDSSSKTFKHFKHEPANPNSISDDRIYSIYEDRQNDLWVGTYGGGLNKFDRKKNIFTCYKNDTSDSTSISADGVWSLIEDDNGNLWAGTFGGGLNKFNRENKTFTHFRHDENNSRSISDDIIISLFEDSDNILWIGTSNGLNKFNSEDESFKNYKEIDGLPNDVIFGIIEDKNKNLWVSTNNGISKFNKAAESFRNYYSDDGLQGNEFNQNSYAQSKITGQIYFGGNNGFNVFKPEDIKENSFIPPIVFSDFKRYNTDNKEGKAIEEKGISVLESVSLSYKDNIIVFEVAALNYYNSSKNQYKYMLEGFNENWIQMGNNHNIIFTNLAYGNYKLLVKGSNNDGVWNESPSSLEIDITPPWWRTNIAYLVYGIIVFGFLFGIRKIEKNNLNQKALIREHELLIIAGESEKRALRVENERKTIELDEARKLQLSMLPRVIPKFEFVDIAAFMRTATEVGGDYYDIVVQSKDEINIAFGDATGHGLQAGTMVTLMKGFFTSDSTKFGMLEFMSHCNKVIKEINLGRILMSLSIIKVEPTKFLLSSGGMPPVYHYSKNTGSVEEILLKGMPLGAMSKFKYSLHEQNVGSGDTILLITDGMPEQINDKEELYDYPRVKDKFIEFAEMQPEEIISNLMKSFDEWNGGSVQTDDISLMVIKFK